LYLPLAVFAYNTVIHSSTKFTPFFLTFGKEARIPSDLIAPQPHLSSGEYAHRLVTGLSRAFADARETQHQNQQREKDWYDTGIVNCLFTPCDIVRLQITNLFAKLASTLFGQHKVF